MKNALPMILLNYYFLKVIVSVTFATSLTWYSGGLLLGWPGATAPSAPALIRPCPLIPLGCILCVALQLFLITGQQEKRCLLYDKSV